MPAPGMAPYLLLSRLGFSHFLELLPLTVPVQQAFYEVQSVRNNWSCRCLLPSFSAMAHNTSFKAGVPTTEES
jgi:predicted nuclease of restriction endonuclease-like (RecB) superfamily